MFKLNFEKMADTFFSKSVSDELKGVPNFVLLLQIYNTWRIINVVEKRRDKILHNILIKITVIKKDCICREKLDFDLYLISSISIFIC